MNILVVDDHPTNRKLLRTQLEAEGHVVLEAADGVEALGALERNQVDAVISDILMPRMDGYRLCYRIRQSEPWKGLPFIMYTATYTSPSDEKLSLDVGADKYVRKPATPTDLLAALREAAANPQRGLAAGFGEMDMLKEYSERLVTKLEQKNLELNAAQARLRELLMHIPAVVYCVDLGREPMSPQVVSENVVRLLGFVLQETRQLDWWLSHLHPEDRERAVSALMEVRERGHLICEYRIQHKDQSYRWVEDNQRLVCDPAGQPVEIVGVWSDITARKQLEEQLRQAQKMEAIGQLAGGVAHDFNNMLAVIIMQATLAETSGSLSEVQAGLQQIHAAAERAANLTQQLLLFSRRHVMQRQALDLNEIVASLSKMLQRIIGEDVHLHLHLHPKQLVTCADAGMLDQVLMNLAVNARDAMPGGGRLVIGTAEKMLDADHLAGLHADAAPGRYVWLSVSDTGTGIPAPILPQLFEPFFTTKTPGKGTGLGLSTVFGIVQQHGGFIKVYSEPGKGADFQIFLPASEVAPAALARAAAQPKPRDGTETILVVEDETPVRLVVRAILERHGYQIMEAAHGVEALEIWDQHAGSIHLLLTDFIMPEGISGWELAAQLRERAPQLRVLFTSGYSPEIAGRELALEPGQNFIQKPYAAQELLEMVRLCLDS